MAFLVVGITLFTTLVSVCSACSCEPTTGLDPTFCRYHIIARGQAVNLDEGADQFESDVYTISVNRIIARNMTSDSDDGASINSFTLKTPSVGALCGADLPLNTDYVFFGKRDEGQYWTYLCSPNGQYGTDTLCNYIGRTCRYDIRCPSTD